MVISIVGDGMKKMIVRFKIKKILKLEHLIKKS